MSPFFRSIAAGLLFILISSIGVDLGLAASNSTKNSFPSRRYQNDFAVMSNSLTDLTTSDTWVFQITIANKTAGAVTATVQDKQGSPVCALCTVSIAANTTYVIAFPEGLKFKSGLSVQAGAANSLNFAIFGFY